MPQFHVRRSIDICASPEVVFDRLADFNTWTTWSPWLIAEPDARVTVTDNADGVGAIYAWQGEVVGAGEIEHRQLERPRRIEDELRFIKPFKSHSQVSFELQSMDSGTSLSWDMLGSLPWFMFWMRPMMETFIGMDFERGLKMLKEWIETGHVASQTKIQGVVQAGPLHMLGVRQTCRVADISSSSEAAFRQAKQLFQQQSLPNSGGMISVYHKFDVKTGTFDYTAGYLVSELMLTQAGKLAQWSLPACQAFCVEHIGSYDHLGNAWSAANQLARHKKLKPCKLGTFELYKSPSSDTPADELRTEIYLPLRG